MTVKWLAVGAMIWSVLAATVAGRAATPGLHRQDDGAARQFASAPPAASDERETANRGSASSSDHTSRAPANPRPAFELSRVDAGVVAEFRKAWLCAGAGKWDIEGLVLLFRNPDGSYLAVSLRYTNEFRSFTFRWQPNAIAIVHTHPDMADPKPSLLDKRVADRLGVPVFTITNRGMFMYDPAVKKTRKVMNKLEWLEADKFRRGN